MAIGILGGTFDPVHNAHIAVAQLAMRQLNLENVLFLPAGDPPHKHARASRWARMEMVRLAVAQTGFSSCDIEVTREGTTYTVDTLRALHARYPQAEFFYIIGTDTLYQLPSWRCFAQVKELTQFAVVRRVGEDVAHAHAFAKSIGIRAAFIEIDAPPFLPRTCALRHPARAIHRWAFAGKRVHVYLRNRAICSQRSHDGTVAQRAARPAL